MDEALKDDCMDEHLLEEAQDQLVVDLDDEQESDDGSLGSLGKIKTLTFTLPTKKGKRSQLITFKAPRQKRFNVSIKNARTSAGDIKVKYNSNKRLDTIKRGGSASKTIGRSSRVVVSLGSGVNSASVKVEYKII